MKHDDDAVLGLRFRPRHSTADPHVIPAMNLVQALDGLQRTIHLVAMMRERKEIRRRARITHDIENRFQLHCLAASEGSYYQRTFIAAKDATLLSQEDVHGVMGTTKGLLAAVNTGDVQLFSETVVDSAYRTPILTALEKMFERQGNHYLLTIEDSHEVTIADSKAAAEYIPRIKESRLPINTQMIVTGILTKIDFKEHKLWLFMSETGRTVECIYDEDVEQTLLENARDLIQVIGTIEIDEGGNPKRVTDIQEIHSVNIDDMDIIDILPANLYGVPQGSPMEMKVKVSLSDDGQSYCAEIPVFGIDLAAHTRIDLIDSLTAEISFLWENIARESDENLAPKAQLLKARLHQYFREVAA